MSARNLNTIVGDTWPTFDFSNEPSVLKVQLGPEDLLSPLHRDCKNLRVCTESPGG